MKLDDLITLHNAGYTKEDIFKILGTEQPAPADPPEQQPAEPAPEEKQEQPKPDAAPADDDKIKQLETKLDYVINRFNYMAVQQSSQPNNGKTESVDDILASVVRGTQKDEKT